MLCREFIINYGQVYAAMRGILNPGSREVLNVAVIAIEVAQKIRRLLEKLTILFVRDNGR